MDTDLLQSPTQAPQPLTTQTHLSGRAKFIAQQSKKIPTTQEGLSIGFWRADMLPEQPSPNNLEDFAQASFTLLNYDEGFPTLPDGRPFWHNLPYEPPEAFACYEIYIECVTEGPRYLQALLGNQELRHLIPHLELPTIQEFYHLYYWKDRARAHDLYKEAAYRHIRQRRALATDDFLYDKSTKLLDRVVTQMESPQFQKDLENDPSLAVNLFEKLVRIRRTAAGLPAQAPSDPNFQRTSPDFEVTMRQVVNQSGIANTQSRDQSSGSNSLHNTQVHPSNTLIDEQGRVIPTNASFLRGALNDPNTARLLQEVVIKVTTDKGATKRPRWFKGQQAGQQVEDLLSSDDQDTDVTTTITITQPQSQSQPQQSGVEDIDRATEDTDGAIEHD